MIEENTFIKEADFSKKLRNRIVLASLIIPFLFFVASAVLAKVSEDQVLVIALNIVAILFISLLVISLKRVVRRQKGMWLPLLLSLLAFVLLATLFGNLEHVQLLFLLPYLLFIPLTLIVYIALAGKNKLTKRIKFFKVIVGVQLFTQLIFTLLFLIYTVSEFNKKEKIELATDSILFPYSLEKNYFSPDKTMGYVNSTGKKVIPALYKETSPFSDGLGAVKSLENNLYGFVDSSGTLAISHIYQSVKPFYEGRAWVREETGDWKLIDKKGNDLTEPIYDYYSTNYNNGYCYPHIFNQTKNSRFLLFFNVDEDYYDIYKMDLDGNKELIVTDTKENNIRDSIDLVARNYLAQYCFRDTNNYDRYGYKKINSSEELGVRLFNSDVVKREFLTYQDSLNATFREAKDFQNGYAKVILSNGKHAYIDTNLQVVFTYEGIIP